MQTQQHTTYMLIVLDGWGYREDTEQNAIAQAHKPHWDSWWAQYPHTLLQASGTAVGLPTGQMGNSEVGHTHLGAGRFIEQDLSRIEQAIESGHFQQNEMFLNAIQHTQAAGGALHILGLLSPGGVHSHEAHIAALCRFIAKHHINFYVHAFLDGRDTPPQSAHNSLEQLEQLLTTLGRGKIASLCGRYYAMDRDQRWQRTQATYDLLTQANAPFHATSATQALKEAYARGETDEFVQATCIGDHPIHDNDSIICMNFRADRMKQISYALTEKNFSHFPRARTPKLTQFVTLTHYADDLNADVAFPPLSIKNTLGEIADKQGLRQLRIAETEKYAHVTFFFNGGKEDPFPHEKRILIPSPQVATYDLQPEMSAPELTNQLVKAISSKQFDVIICNFANADMVGHTGNLAATIQAINCLDECLHRIVTAAQEHSGELLITADHGNAECLFDATTQQAHTAHTSNPVPLLYIGRKAHVVPGNGGLQDVAPTLLYIMGLPIPDDMTGIPRFTIEGN